MLKSQEIEMEQSKRREKMAAINGKEEVDEEDTKQLRSLSSAYETGEVQKRAAMLLENEERSRIQVPDKAAQDFERECRSFSLSAVVSAIEGGKVLSGREAEVSKELEVRHGAASRGIRLPWETLAPLETRADVSTTTVNAVAGYMASHPTMKTLERFFEASVAAKFGFQSLAVEGKPSFPQIDSGAALSWVGEGVGSDAAAIATTTKTPTIKTATARYLLSRQATRENSALEMVLRRDLAELLREGIDLAVFQGTGAADQPAGLGAVLTAASRTTALTDRATFSALLSYAVQLMETAKVSDLSQIRIAGAPILAQTMLDALVNGTAVSEMDRLKSAGFSALFSQQVSGHAARDGTGKGASVVYFGAGEGNAFVVNWGTPELIVDPYSESKNGKISLTLFAFLDVIVQRAATHFYRLSAVQDRI